jgi:hypothetical protein
VESLISAVWAKSDDGLGVAAREGKGRRQGRSRAEDLGARTCWNPGADQAVDAPHDPGLAPQSLPAQGRGESSSMMRSRSILLAKPLLSALATPFRGAAVNALTVVVSRVVRGRSGVWVRVVGGEV